MALKSRTIPAAEAIDQSLAALAWLQAQGARQILFKYCSTFNSTDQGNIGPVSEALLDALGADFTIACPALPENGRSVYMGHLFVGERLLSDTHMRHHPLTPMTDSNLVAVLGRQSKAPVGLVPYPVVERGPEAIRARFAELRRAGVRQAIADATSDRHLVDLGTAAADLALITGGSGIAMGLPANFRRAGLLGGDRRGRSAARGRRPRGGAGRQLLGSDAGADRALCRERAGAGARSPGAGARRRGSRAGDRLGRAAAGRGAAADPLVGAARGGRAGAGRRSGRERAGAAIEAAMARIARALVERGVRRLVVAGGETSGAVVAALGVRALRIGPPIDPGVPWTVSLGEPHLALALKSGNFGAPDFFRKAFACAP